MKELRTGLIIKTVNLGYSESIRGSFNLSEAWEFQSDMKHMAARAVSRTPHLQRKSQARGKNSVQRIYSKTRSSPILFPFYVWLFTQDAPSL